jgi:hypothetical protein
LSSLFAPSDNSQARIVREGIEHPLLPTRELAEFLLQTRLEPSKRFAWSSLVSGRYVTSETLVFVLRSRLFMQLIGKERLIYDLPVSAIHNQYIKYRIEATVNTQGWKCASS